MSIKFAKVLLLLFATAHVATGKTVEGSLDEVTSTYDDGAGAEGYKVSISGTTSALDDNGGDGGESKLVVQMLVDAQNKDCTGDDLFGCNTLALTVAANATTK